VVALSAAAAKPAAVPEATPYRAAFARGPRYNCRGQCCDADDGQGCRRDDDPGRAGVQVGPRVPAAAARQQQEQGEADDGDGSPQPLRRRHPPTVQPRGQRHREQQPGDQQRLDGDQGALAQRDAVQDHPGDQREVAQQPCGAAGQGEDEPDVSLIVPGWATAARCWTAVPTANSPALAKASGTATASVTGSSASLASHCPDHRKPP